MLLVYLELVFTSWKGSNYYAEKSLIRLFGGREPIDVCGIKASLNPLFVNMLALQP